MPLCGKCILLLTLYEKLRLLKENYLLQSEITAMRAALEKARQEEITELVRHQNQQERERANILGGFAQVDGSGASTDASVRITRGAPGSSHQKRSTHSTFINADMGLGRNGNGKP
jgi:hypothetical protein